MNNADKERFASSLRAIHEVHGRDPSADAMQIWWGLLSPHSIETVEWAMYRVMRKSKFPPKPHDVLAEIDSLDGRPGAEQAWRYALALMDESATGWTNPEIDQAWGAAQPIYQSGDEVGARMAFREAYEEIVNEARMNGRPVKWRLSLGHDASERNEKVYEAQAAGQLSGPQAERLLGHVPVPPDQVQKLLGGPQEGEKPDPEVARGWLDQLRNTVKKGGAAPQAGDDATPDAAERRAPTGDADSVDGADESDNE